MEWILLDGTVIVVGLAFWAVLWILAKELPRRTVPRPDQAPDATNKPSKSKGG